VGANTCETTRNTPKALGTKPGKRVANLIKRSLTVQVSGKNGKNGREEKRYVEEKGGGCPGGGTGGGGAPRGATGFERDCNDRRKGGKGLSSWVLRTVEERGPPWTSRKKTKGPSA